MDTLTPAQRSERMARVEAKDTKPKLRVRRLFHRPGYRYRLHRDDLPGRPDLVFLGRKAIIPVHGCFWRSHPGPARTPKSRSDFWLPKLGRNRTRDEDVLSLLNGSGWRVLTLWECELRDTTALEAMIREFLGRGRLNSSRRRADYRPLVTARRI